MATQNFEVGDLVFAKLKGYPAWPAVITNVKERLKSSPKECRLYEVYFFGSKNYGFIKADNIFLYETHKEKFHAKTASYKAALYEIEDYKKEHKNINFPETDSKRCEGLEERRIIDDCFAALNKTEDSTGSSSYLFSLNHINLSDSDKSQDISKLDNILSALRKLKNDKGDENNCFTNKDDLFKKHNGYLDSKLVSTFLDVVNKFEDYVSIKNKDTFDDPRIRDLDRYSAILKNIKDYMYGQTNVFNPDNKDFLNEPSSSKDFQNEISLEDMFFNALQEMSDYLKKDATILEATIKLIKLKDIHIKSFSKAVNAFQDHIYNLTPKNKEIFDKPSTKYESEKKGSDINRNVSNGNNEEVLSTPSCSKKFQNKKLDVYGKDKKLHSRKCFPKISLKKNIVSKPYKRKVNNLFRNTLSSENNKQLPQENISGNQNCPIDLEGIDLSPMVLVERLDE